MPASPALAAGRFLLGLDDDVTPLRAFEGGNVRADVVVSAGPGIPRKTIAGLKFEPFVVRVGGGVGGPLATWIQAALEPKSTPKDGFIVAVSVDNKAQSYRRFQGAVIQELTIPALDANSKDAAFFTIGFHPDGIGYDAGDGAVVKPKVNTKQKRWMVSNFRLTLGDLPCKRVSKIDSATIRISKSDPSRIEFPDLRVVFSAADAGPWHDWFMDFVVHGNNGDGRELQGAIEFLDPGLTTTLGSVELRQVGIYALSYEPTEANNDAVARYVAELYVESMSIKFS